MNALIVVACDQVPHSRDLPRLTIFPIPAPPEVTLYQQPGYTEYTYTTNSYIMSSTWREFMSYVHHHIGIGKWKADLGSLPLDNDAHYIQLPKIVSHLARHLYFTSTVGTSTPKSLRGL